MDRDAKFAAGGLLSGFGQGLEIVAGRRYGREKAAADDLRSRSLSDYNRAGNDASEQVKHDRNLGEAKEALTEGREFAATRRTEEEGKTAGLLIKAQERQDLLRTQDQALAGAADERYDPESGMMVKTTYDKTGKNAIRSTSRGLTEAEQQKYGTGVGAMGKFDSSKDKVTRKLVGDRFATDVLSKYLDDPDSMAAFMVKNDFTGDVEINVPKMRAEHPEAAAQYDMLNILVSEENKVSNNPDANVAAAMIKLDKIGKDDIEKAVVGKIAKASGATEKQVTATRGMSPKKVEGILAAAADGDTMSEEQEQLIKLARPEVYSAYKENVKTAAEKRQTMRGGEQGYVDEGSAPIPGEPAPGAAAPPVERNPGDVYLGQGVDQIKEDVSAYNDWGKKQRQKNREEGDAIRLAEAQAEPGLLNTPMVAKQ